VDSSSINTAAPHGFAATRRMPSATIGAALLGRRDRLMVPAANALQLRVQRVDVKEWTRIG
jgi:hypothetical protein